MRSIAIAMALYASTSSAEGADGGVARVLAMLKSNSIVEAAVAQGRAFSGASSCDYKVTATEASHFQPGTTFDYVADITCSGKNHGEEAGSTIHVTGTMFSDGPQALTLSILFAE
jgi:hypothetical protein